MNNIGTLYDVTSARIQQTLADALTLGGDAPKTNEVTDSFENIFNSAIGLIESTNQYVQDAQKAEIDFALGNLTNTHELGVIQQKANLALQYTVAIRDKLVEAYREIMNMQI